MTGSPLVTSLVSVASSQEWIPETARWVFATVRDGFGYVLSGAQTYALSPGDSVIFSPVGDCRVLASQLGDLTLLQFAAAPADLGSLLALSDCRQLELIGTTKPVMAPVRLPADHPLSRIWVEILESSPHWLARRPLLASLAARYWSGLLPSETSRESSQTNALGRFDELVRLLSATELASRSPEELQKECGCSGRHFSRLFQLRFGRSFREFQIEQRLLRARDLLGNHQVKVIDVALESGFRHLGLFNAMFKRRFGVTPSDWRTRQESKNPRRRSVRASLMRHSVTRVTSVLLLWAAIFTSGFLLLAQTQTNVPPATLASPASGSGTFELRSFQVEGNTLLSTNVLEDVFRPYITNRATLGTLRSALTALQLAYRGRGWVTVSPTLPPQQLTNGIVRVVVTEGLLTQIQVVGNKHHSSNNVMSVLPSLRTNIHLNSAWFQAELDRANESRDRQIYPVIAPGPDPGTTALTLKVKDRLPLHGRLELNNKGTIGTPPLRIDSSVQYNNLWQEEHQIGLQYNFSPQRMKSESQMPRFWNQPLDAAYSTFYRLPLLQTQALLDKPEFAEADFGYDPVTRKFREPPATGRPEMIFFASGSNQDTGVATGPLLTVADTPLVRIQSQATGQDLTVNKGAGSRVQSSLPALGILRSSLSFGPDWKSYESQSFNTNTFFSRIILTNNNEPVIIERVTAFDQPLRAREIQYLPLSLGWNGNWADKWGSSFLSLGQAVNVADLRSVSQVGTNLAFGTLDPGHYYVINPSFIREQKLGGDWGLSLRANGQWSDRDLIDNEKYVLGGTQGVRGYQEAEESHSSAWRVQFEPHTPWYNLGPIDGTELMRARFSAFTDMGRGYRHSDLPQPDFLWGTGLGTAVAISDWLEGRFQMAWALRESPATPAGTFRVYFSVAVQF